ncbi:MAG: T9SS type A sorting domain-containing protein [Bacteroidales bacterium]|jgi:hypothetical protein|nr:T9SS type A sorting domain-containing protein [Bacteroidales bacterium]
MKKIFLLLGFVCAFNVLSAQHFTIKHEDGTDYTNAQIDIYRNPAIDFLSEHFNLVNETMSNLKLGLRKTIISADNYMEASFCVAINCYAASVMELPEGDRPDIVSGESTLFFADFNSVDEEWNIVSGTIKVLYEFYSDEFPNDISTLTITFNNGLTGIDIFEEKYETSVYPNPVIDVANFVYRLPEGQTNATLTIMSYTGNKLREINLPKNQNKISVNLSDLPTGIYLYSINSGGKTIATNKLVVQ